MKLTSGMRLGPYEIVAPIGAGGMGEVYRARDTRLDRTVAVKILPSEFADDARLKARFEREAKTISALSHPHICSLFDVGDSYIVMEYCEGRTLAKRIAEDALPLEQVLDYGIQIADALDQAHQQGIVHRDLKPSNIILTKSGVKLLDFGLAKQRLESSPAESTVEQVTEEGKILGTVQYMAPELFAAREADARSDIFALGLILYEMAMGKPAFAGESKASLIASILRDEPQPITDLKPKSPRSLDRLIRACLMKDPNERIQTVHDVVLQLKWIAETVSRPGRSAAERTRTLRGWTAAAVAFLLLGVISALALRREKIIPRNASTVAAAPKSRVTVAVLPFSNLGGEPENEYFSDGLTEDLIYGLSKLERLELVPRASAFFFKRRPVESREAGRRLGAHAVIEGSVRRSRDRLRVVVRLINVADGRQLWAERFDRGNNDVFAVQDEISFALINALKIQLQGEERQAILRRYRGNPEAHNLYLKGRFFRNKGSPDGLLKAVEFFKRAIALDSGYAAAYGSLAESELILGVYFMPPSEWMPLSKAHALEALQIDPRLSEAHVYLGLVNLLYEWDWPRAARELQLRGTLNPKAIETFSCSAHLLEGAGLGKEALLEVKEALEIDPLSIPLITELGCASYYARNYDDALRYYHNALEYESTNIVALWGVARSYSQKGNPRESVDLLRDLKSKMGNMPPILLAELGYALAVLGRRDESDEVVRELDRLSSSQWVDPYLPAIVYAGMNDKERALNRLNKAVAERSAFIPSLATEPKWDGFRMDQRFTSLLTRVGLGEAPHRPAV